MMQGAAVLVLGLMAGAANAANFGVVVTSNSFSPRELTVRVGDSVSWSLAETEPGYGGGTFAVPHNVRADDDSFDSGPPAPGPWTYAFTFTAPGQYRYYCSNHGARGGVGMSGTVTVEAVQATPGGPLINEGLSGAWYNPEFTGQGFFLDVNLSSGLLGLSWFTWSEQPGAYDWLTGVGTFQGSRADILLNRTRGGQFNTTRPVTDSDAGNVILQFTDCSHADLSFVLTDPPRTGSMVLSKLLPASASCLSAASAGEAQAE